MTGQRVGYIRISTDSQHTDRQLVGIPLDKTFTDIATGSNTKREQFQEMMRYLREGDTLFVHELDRIGRNMMEVMETVNILMKRGVIIEFITERLRYTPNPTPIEELMFHISSSYSQFETKVRARRQAEGIAEAKKRGAYKGRKPAYTHDKKIEMKKKIDLGIPKARVAREYGISKVTMYKYLRHVNVHEPNFLEPSEQRLAIAMNG